MKDKIWSFADEKLTEKTAYEYLVEYASKLKNDTNNLVEGVVTDMTSSASTEITYALYLVVPLLKNYSYRLIEVIQPNVFTPYPVKMKLFGKAAGNIVEEEDINGNNFEKKLIDFITSPLTKLILLHLKTHIDIAGKLKVGEARIATLKTGEKVNIGVVKIEDDFVYCLTGKGLREMYKPNMTKDEEKKAVELRNLNDEEKINRQLMVKMKFEEFENIE